MDRLGWFAARLISGRDGLGLTLRSDPGLAGSGMAAYDVERAKFRCSLMEIAKDEI